MKPRSSFLLPLAAALAAFLFVGSASALAGDVNMTTFSSGNGGINVFASPMSAFPAVSASDWMCAENRGMQRDAIQYTPTTLAVACGVTATRIANEAYTTAMFIHYVDMYRYSVYCPSPYEGGPGSGCKF